MVRLLRTYPVKFRRQTIIDRFIVDFYCPASRLVVEIDGSQHYAPDGQAYDAERDAILKEYGCDILRFSNHDINTDFAAVCERIDQCILARTE